MKLTLIIYEMKLIRISNVCQCDKKKKRTRERKIPNREMSVPHNIHDFNIIV